MLFEETALEGKNREENALWGKYLNDAKCLEIRKFSPIFIFAPKPKI